MNMESASSSFGVNLRRMDLSPIEIMESASSSFGVNLRRMDLLQVVAKRLGYSIKGDKHYEQKLRCIKSNDN